jgi:hypothetical protein
MRAAAFEVANRYVAADIPDPAWADWACWLIPTVVQEAVIAWLDAGRPGSPEDAAERIVLIINGIEAAAKTATDTERPGKPSRFPGRTGA